MEYKHVSEAKTKSSGQSFWRFFWLEIFAFKISLFQEATDVPKITTEALLNKPEVH